jgi:hypothetical protein
MARFLLEEQPADLAHLPLALIDAGLDNELWRPGDNQLVRLPRRAVAAQLILNERRWLPAITPRLPPPVPVPVRVGSPNANFRWPGQSCRGWSAPAHEAPRAARRRRTVPRAVPALVARACPARRPTQRLARRCTHRERDHVRRTSIQSGAHHRRRRDAARLGRRGRCAGVARRPGAASRRSSPTVTAESARGSKGERSDGPCCSRRCAWRSVARAGPATRDSCGPPSRGSSPVRG